MSKLPSLATLAAGTALVASVLAPAHAASAKNHPVTSHATSGHSNAVNSHTAGHGTTGTTPPPRHK
ncbi:MAG TPA: hypothetical protein VKX28_30795 [Xanthobacteraceae bacterium]|nr:hypothetical protein [Xanthobacteraceae bacterium]